CMQGEQLGAPHPIVDPRDLKYCRNRCTAEWNPQDDPFRWRDRLPVARWGWAELLLMGVPLLAATLLAASAPWPVRLVVVVPAALLGLVLFFFRDPRRQVPDEPGQVVSPADGKIVEITRMEEEPFVGGPAVRIGIFLSIFNVHLNRAPVDARVVRLEYHPGEFLNAMNPESALRNEAMKIGLEEAEPPYRKMIVRQISGLIARRIVCALRPGEVVRRGAVFGMIKLGSRTELVLPADRLSIDVSLGQKVQAGSTVLAHYG
ncbi:MAG: phosphatidylserine decarboxylase family protein, partial [Pirellulales bacterium]